jgi:hypothetical protein
MNARRNGFGSGAAAPTIGVAVLLLVALVAVIGSAQAAPTTKLYSATVRLTTGATIANKFTLTLKNDEKSKQTLGSANFTAPANFTVPTSTQTPTNGAGHTWTIASNGTSLVTFRAASNAHALAPGESVSAIISDVAIPVGAGCGSATWVTQAKQSNDFSGQPGNDLELNAQASDLRPLGSFTVSTIETVEDGQHIPARITGEPFTWTATAKDTCGATKTTYSGATLTHTFLTGASFTPPSGLNFSGGNGSGTVEIVPQLTETGNNLTVTDAITGVTKTSNFFDVSDTLCTPADVDPCHWQDKKGNPGILADATAPPPGANLGIGFNPILHFSCNSVTTPVGGSVVNINPRGYTAPFTVSLTYKKSVTGSGPASSFGVCVSEDDDGSTWTTAANCPSTPVPANAPCVQTKKRTSGGDLLIVLYLTQEDPWGGLT